MPGRLISDSSMRDALLVVMVATLAFALGVSRMRTEPNPTTLQMSAAGPGKPRFSTVDSVLEFGPTLRTLALVAAARTQQVSLDTRHYPATTATMATSTLEERFSGEGGGRRDISGGSDPFSRRAYLLDTAALMLRRGWIGLERDEVGKSVSR